MPAGNDPLITPPGMRAAGLRASGPPSPRSFQSAVPHMISSAGVVGGVMGLAAVLSPGAARGGEQDEARRTFW